MSYLSHSFGRGSWCLVGAPGLCAGPGGRWCYEVEVVEPAGELLVGFAGTNLGPQCTVVGNDACSWGFFSGDGNGWHGCVATAGTGAWQRLARVRGNGWHGCVARARLI